MISFSEEEFAPFYKNYIALANQEISIVEGLVTQLAETLSFFQSVPTDKLDFKYAEGKWSIKDILMHLIDTERIFTYRALRISRKDAIELPGFDENNYVNEAKASQRAIKNLLDEYTSVRNATISLFQSFDKKQLLRIGMASNSSISVRAIGYLIQGHEKHHLQNISQKYL